MRPVKVANGLNKIRAIEVNRYAPNNVTSVMRSSPWPVQYVIK